MAAAFRSAPVTSHATYLSEIRIRNFALILEQQVHLTPGLNVITGESGSGKSVVIAALSQALGAPADDDLIRPPSETATAQAVFCLSAAGVATAKMSLKRMEVSDRAIPNAAGQLILSREISRSLGDRGPKRSRCSINGVTVPLRCLRELAAELVDMNGQHAAQSLREAAMQLRLLDRVAGCRCQAAHVAQCWERYQQLRQQMADIASVGGPEQRLSLSTLIASVEQSAVEPGEERQLRGKLRQLEARQDAAEQCQLASMLLGSNSGAVGAGLQNAEQTLRLILSQEMAHANSITQMQSSSVADTDEGDGADMIGSALEGLQEARRLVTSADRQVKQYARQFGLQEDQKAALGSRLRMIERLFKQNGLRTSEDLLEAATQAQDALQRWDDLEGRQDEIQGEMERTEAEMLAAALQLSRQRKAAVQSLKASVESCLADLAMPGSCFDIDLRWQLAHEGDGHYVNSNDAKLLNMQSGTYKLGPHGLDHATLQLAAGPSEPLRPLSMVASGGESSRIMLALKAAPIHILEATHDERPQPASDASQDIPIMVLDEMDSGVGARLGGVMGRLLQRMAATSLSQLLCITHLPQVAACASSHICVSKRPGADGRIQTVMHSLITQEMRNEEMSAMMGLQ
ncbi:hypothetical protein WJX74_010352 [Apatococcus lobatus]|uniref:DNA repair protein RecN n=1 Tax=Apatococcus lobatus TaxID=904363 RepID=A0AAW1PXR6_9CHLO